MNTLQVEPDSSPKKSINYNIRRTYYKLHNTDDLKQKQPRIEDWDVTEKQKKFLIKCRETYNKDITHGFELKTYMF